MLLAYEYEALLINKENKKEVASILRDLDFDIGSPELARYRQELMQRLKQLGEQQIYERLLSRFEMAS